jgi:diketogulonate reductase-like aldo/keto reductase
MEMKELAKTGVRLPEIGLGTWRYHAGVEPLRRGIALGATFIDTAEVYGTEGLVGEAIKEQRRQLFIATKVSGDHLRSREVLKAVDGSLKRLGTDYIDLYQIHWPNPRVPIGETMEAMERLVDEGKVRFIGVSNFSTAELQGAQSAMRKHRIVSNQVLYNLLHREIEDDLSPYCQEQGVAVIAYSPLAEGELVSGRASGNRRGMGVLARVAQEAGKTPAQVALNWCIAKPHIIAIPKAGRVEHVEDDCGASGWRLSPEQLMTLDHAFG